MVDDALMFAHEDDDNPCPADIAMSALEVAEKAVLKIIDEHIAEYPSTLGRELLTRLRAKIYKEFNDG